MRRTALLSVLACFAAAGCSDEPSSPVLDHATDVPPAVVAARSLVDVTDAWSLDFQHDNGSTEARQLPETMGHGAALFDADEDGDLDLYLVQGGTYGTLPNSATNRLFANDGQSFRDITPASGAAGDTGYGMGVAVGDANGDGHVDLYLTNFGADRMVVGDGKGHFANDQERALVVDERWTTAVTFFDPDADGDLDLFVVAYVAIDVEHPPWCGRKEPAWRTVCHPDLFDGLADRLWMNDGTGVFSEERVERGIVSAPGKGLGVVVFDADDDGWTDLYVANDSVENHLWRNLGAARFEDFTLIAGVGVNRYGATEAGMGLAVGDLDGDLDAEVVVTNFDHESHTVYRNESVGLFTDATPQFGLEAATRLAVGFGVLALDLDRDRDLDLCIVNGHIVERIALYDDAQSWRQEAQVFRNESGSFTLDSALGGDFTATARVGRGLVAGDLDGDGDLDLIATECGGRTRIFENRSRADGDLRAAQPTLRLVGLAPGARVRATYVDDVAIVREVGPATSYLSQSSADVLLPLEVPLAKIEVRRPGRDWQLVDGSLDPGSVLDLQLK